MTDNMDPTGFNNEADTLAWRKPRGAQVCDVVESVRWMKRDVTIAFRGYGVLAAFAAKIVVAGRATTFIAPIQRS